MNFDQICTAPAFISLLSVNQVLAGVDYQEKAYRKKYRRAKFCVTVVDVDSDKINSYQLTVIKKSNGISLTELVCESEEHSFVTLDSFQLQEDGEEINLTTTTNGDGEELEFKIGSFSLQ